MKLFDMIRLSRQNYSDEVLSRLTKADSREAKKLSVLICT